LSEEDIKIFFKTPVKPESNVEALAQMKDIYLRLKRILAKKWTEAPLKTTTFKSGRDHYEAQLKKLEEAYVVGTRKTI